MTTTETSGVGVKADLPAKAGHDGATVTPSRTCADPALRRKALACIREGRVRVVRAVDTDQVVRRVLAIVLSSRSPNIRYAVDGSELDGHGTPRWDCSCNAGMRNEPCPHVAAVQLVTVGAIA